MTQWWNVWQMYLCSAFKMHCGTSTVFRNCNQSPYNNRWRLGVLWAWKPWTTDTAFPYLARPTKHLHSAFSIYLESTSYMHGVLCNHRCYAICHVGFAWGGRLRCLKSYHQYLFRHTASYNWNLDFTAVIIWESCYIRDSTPQCRRIAIYL